MTNRTTTSWLLALVAVFTVVGVWFANRQELARENALAGGSTAQDRVVRGADAPTPESATADLTAARAQEGRTGIEMPPEPAAPAEPAVDALATGPIHVTGRVLGLHGEPVPALAIAARSDPGRMLARSRGDGSFEAEVTEAHAILAASSAGFATVRSLPIAPAGVRDGLVIVGPVVAVSGIVVDASGLGLEGARVAIETDETLLSRFPLPLDTTAIEPMPSVESGPGGAFDLPRSIAAAGAKLAAKLDGYEDARIDAPRSPSYDVRLVLERAESKDRFVTGTVVRADGEPATQARVHLGDDQVATDSRGAFRLQLPQWLRDAQPLVAVEKGSQAASLEDFGLRVRNAGAAVDPVRLVLGPAPLSIAGRVVDDRGAPLADWRVGLVRGTPVTVGRVPPITAESLTSGAEPFTHTDEKGAFCIDGLGARDYELCAFDSVSLARIETPPIPSGKQDVEIRLGADTFVERVTGRVVARDGAPVAEAVVSVGLMMAQDEGASSWINGTTVKADQEGRFELVRVPRRFIHFDVGGDMVLPRKFALADLDLEQPLRLEVERRCHFRVEGLPTGGGAGILDASPKPGSERPKPVAGGSLRWLGAYSADGKEMQVLSFQSGGWSSMNRQQVTTGTTKVYAVGETAVELRLYDTYDHVAARRPLHLVPGEVTVVQW